MNSCSVDIASKFTLMTSDVRVAPPASGAGVAREKNSSAESRSSNMKSSILACLGTAGMGALAPMVVNTLRPSFGCQGIRADRNPRRTSRGACGRTCSTSGGIERNFLRYHLMTPRVGIFRPPTTPNVLSVQWTRTDHSISDVAGRHFDGTGFRPVWAVFSANLMSLWLLARIWAGGGAVCMALRDGTTSERLGVRWPVSWCLMRKRACDSRRGWPRRPSQEV